MGKKHKNLILRSRSKNGVAKDWPPLVDGIFKTLSSAKRIGGLTVAGHLFDN
jgi:hypothetical protein